MALSATRPVGAAIGAVTCGEIDAWARLSRVRLTPWELDTLLLMDRAARSAFGTQMVDAEPEE